MRNQRGIAQGWLLGALAVAVLTASAYFYGRHDGAKLNETAWQAREAKINAEAISKIAAAHDRVRGLEQDIAQLLANESAGYQAKLKEKDRALKIALDAVRDGTGRLFVNATCLPAGGNPAGSAAAPASGRDGSTRAELSATDSNFLLELGAEADKVVLQLTACQAVVRADRTR